MLRYGIPEYRLPRDIIESEFSLIDRLGGEIKFNTEIGKDILFETLEKEYDAVLVSIGKQLGRKDRSLNNCDANGVLTAVEFLREISLTRESKEAKGNVLTVGGGDVAMDCARSALRLKNSNDSYVIFLEKNLESLTASKHEVEGAIAEGVKFIPSSGIKEILINEEGRVNGVIVKRCESIFNEKGEFSPKFNEENLEKIDVDTLIFAIGQGVDLTISSGDRFQFNRESLQNEKNPKVFYAGDCASSNIVVQAMAEGRRAAKSIIRFLNNEDVWLSLIHI